MTYIFPTYFDCVEQAAALAAGLSRGLDEKVLIFCEDKLTLSCELALAEKTGGSFSVEVSSFGRYIRKRSKDAALTKEGCAMAIRRILSSLKEKLSAFKTLSSSPSLPAQLSELIAQLKSAKITPADLFSCLDGCPKNVAAKLGDIALVFDGYEKFLDENSLKDSNNALAGLPALFRADETLKNSHVIFTGFSSVTKQICEAVKAAFETALTCDFICVAGENKDLYTCEFYDFAQRLGGGKPVSPPSSATEEAISLLERLCDPLALSIPGTPTDKVFIYEANAIAEECDFVAATIRREITQGNLRYRDIAIAVGDSAEYSLKLSDKLADYRIPHFIDEKKTLSAHPLARLIGSLLRFCERGGDAFELENVISSSLFISDKSAADGFLRLIKTSSCTPRAFLKGEIDFGDVLFEAKRGAISRFFNNFTKKDEAKNHAVKVREFLAYAGVNENAEALSFKLKEIGAEKERDFLSAGIKAMDETLSEIETVLGDETVTSAEFLKILEAGEEAYEISLLPQRYDCVYVSDAKNCRFKKYKVLFAVGLDSSFPSVKSDVALITDSDIDKLDALEVKVEPKIRAVNKREKEACALALASFDDKLYMSYSVSSKNSGVSEFIEHAVAAFSDGNKKLKAFTRFSIERAKRLSEDENLKDEAATFYYSALRPAMLSLAKDLDDFKTGATGDIDAASAFCRALKSFDGGKALDLANSLIEKINREVALVKSLPIENVFKNKLVSASILETYYSCPYKNFLKYGVGLSDAVTANARPADNGNILHAVAENFIKRLDEVKTEEDAERIADEIFDEIISDEKYSRFMRRADYKYSYMLVKRESEKFCAQLYKQFSMSLYKPVGTEIWFADWGDFKPLPLGGKQSGYRLFGKADRLDKFVSKSGETYYRIIDYKTGKVADKIKDEALYTGVNLQLYLYLNAFVRNGEKIGGAYYYEVGDKFVAATDKFIPLRGKTLIGDENLEATEKDFAASGEATYIKAKIKSTKNGEKCVGEVADGETLSAYMLYAKKLAENGVDDIASGVILSTPMDGACRYCEYASICLHDPTTDDRTRKPPKVTPKTIADAVGANISAEEVEE